MGDLSRAAPWRDPLATSVFMLLVGIVIIVLRMGAVSMVVAFAGMVLMLYGSICISRGIRSRDGSSDMTAGLLAAVLGLLLVVMTGTMVTLMIYVMGAFMIAAGVLAILGNRDAGKRRSTVALAVGVLFIVLGLVVILYPGVTSDTAMLVIGIVLVVVSSINIWSYVR